MLAVTNCHDVTGRMNGVQMATGGISVSRVGIGAVHSR